MKLLYRIGIGLIGVVSLALAALAVAISWTSDCEPLAPVAEGEVTMKAVAYTCYGGPAVLQYADIAKPSPADDEVLVRVRAAAVNPLDWHYMRGSPYFMRLGTGLGKPDVTRLGVDFAGVVESVGARVSRFRPGDAVFGSRTGAFAQYVTVAESRGIAHMPDAISFAQAAAAPVAGLTALQALRDVGGVEAGQAVLINGASGGVGTFAVQIAKAFGAEVSGVCSTRNVEMVQGLGADRVFDYKREDYTKGSHRFDLIVDMIGNHSLVANERVLMDAGRLVIVGGPQGDWLRPLVRPIGAMLLSPFVDQDLGMMLATTKQDDLATLADLMASGQVTPVIDRVYPLSGVADAIRYSETGRARGKIIITVD